MEKLVCFTDGSAGLATADPRVRRVGWAAIYAYDVDDLLYPNSIVWGKLQGSAQTVPRGEMTAAIKGIEHAPAPLHSLVTDCSFISNMAKIPIRKWKPQLLENGDLVQQLKQQLLTSAAPTMQHIFKVKSHEDSSNTLQDCVHVVGNNLADAAAGYAAQQAYLEPQQQQRMANTAAADKRSKAIVERLAAIATQTFAEGALTRQEKRQQQQRQRQRHLVSGQGKGAKTRRLLALLQQRSGHMLLPEGTGYYCQICLQKCTDRGRVQLLKKECQPDACLARFPGAPEPNTQFRSGILYCTECIEFLKSGVCCYA